MGAVVAGLSVASGVMSILNGNKAAKAEREAAARQEWRGKQNAAFIERETMEEVRRAERQHAQLTALAEARAHASGIQVVGSSMDLFIKDQQTEFREQIGWMLQAGASRAEMARLGGEDAAALTRASADATQARGWQQAISSIGRGISAGTSWWGSYKATGNMWTL